MFGKNRRHKNASLFVPASSTMSQDDSILYGPPSPTSSSSAATTPRGRAAHQSMVFLSRDKLEVDNKKMVRTTAQPTDDFLKLQNDIMRHDSTLTFQSKDSSSDSPPLQLEKTNKTTTKQDKDEEYDEDSNTSDFSDLGSTDTEEEDQVAQVHTQISIEKISIPRLGMNISSTSTDTSPEPPKNSESSRSRSLSRMSISFKNFAKALASPRRSSISGVGPDPLSESPPTSSSPTNPHQRKRSVIVQLKKSLDQMIASPSVTRIDTSSYELMKQEYQDLSGEDVIYRERRRLQEVKTFSPMLILEHMHKDGLIGEGYAINHYYMDKDTTKHRLRKVLAA